MHAQAKYRNPNDWIEAKLGKGHYDWRKIKGGDIIVDGPFGGPLPENEDMKPEYCIHAEESGGALGAVGVATIITGYGGQALTPYWIKVCSGPHAKFAKPGPIVVLRFERIGNDVGVEITEYYLDQERPYELKFEVCWAGDVTKVPSQYKRFYDAQLAGMKKVFDQRCEYAYFYERGGGLWHGSQQSSTTG
jgi:hypothetical protein